MKKTGTKKRERLAIEAYVRAKKVRGQALVFTADDVIKHHGGKMKLPKRSVVKALQNMIYTTIGVDRGDDVGQCAVNTDSISWLTAAVPEAVIVGAASGNVRKRRTTMAAARIRNPRKTMTASESAPEMVQHIMAIVEKSLTQKAEDFMATAARLLAALD